VKRKQEEKEWQREEEGMPQPLTRSPLGHFTLIQFLFGHSSQSLSTGTTGYKEIVSK